MDNDASSLQTSVEHSSFVWKESNGLKTWSRRMCVLLHHNLGTTNFYEMCFYESDAPDCVALDSVLLDEVLGFDAGPLVGVPEEKRATWVISPPQPAAPPAPAATEEPAESSSVSSMTKFRIQNRSRQTKPARQSAAAVAMAAIAAVSLVPVITVPPEHGGASDTFKQWTIEFGLADRLVRLRFELESEYQLWLDLLKQRSHILQRPIVFEGPVLFRHPARLEAGFQSAHAVLTSGAQLLLFASTAAASAAIQLIQDAMSSNHSASSIDTGADELIDIGDAWFQEVQEMDMMPFLFVVQRTTDGTTESLAQCVVGSDVGLHEWISALRHSRYVGTTMYEPRHVLHRLCTTAETSFVYIAPPPAPPAPPEALAPAFSAAPPPPPVDSFVSVDAVKPPSAYQFDNVFSSQAPPPPPPAPVYLAPPPSKTYGIGKQGGASVDQQERQRRLALQQASFEKQKQQQAEAAARAELERRSQAAIAAEVERKRQEAISKLLLPPPPKPKVSVRTSVFSQEQMQAMLSSVLSTAPKVVPAAQPPPMMYYQAAPMQYVMQPQMMQPTPVQAPKQMVPVPPLATSHVATSGPYPTINSAPVPAAVAARTSLPRSKEPAPVLSNKAAASMFLLPAGKK